MKITGEHIVITVMFVVVAALAMLIAEPPADTTVTETAPYEYVNEPGVPGFDLYAWEVGDDNADGIIEEDESGWDCTTMGNTICGPWIDPAQMKALGAALLTEVE